MISPIRRLAVASLATALLLAGPAAEAAGERWTSGFGQGWREARIAHATGDAITVSCDVGAASQLGSHVGVTLGGRPAAGGQEILMQFDGGEIHALRAGQQGLITSMDPVGAESFAWLIGRLKRHGSVRLGFGDAGPSAEFTLAGSGKAIADCPPGSSR